MATNSGKFKNVLNQLITKLNEIGTEEQRRELQRHRMKIDAGMKINCKGTIGLFIDSVSPFADHILKEDDDYFMNTDFSQDSEFVKLHDQLKEWWPQLDDAQRTYIRNKVKLLLIIGALVCRDESLRQVINKYRDPSNPLVFD